MARHVDPPAPADYVVAALSPVLVMGLVGSLVFFLSAVLYAGQYAERLNWTLFFFVAGSVLVARIAIQFDASRAALYGLALAGVTYLALLAFVGYPTGTWLAPLGWLINLGLIAVVWWSTHTLTRDCTHVDDRAEASDRGLLEDAGLEPTESPDDVGFEVVEAEEDPPPGWWERYRRYRETQAKRPRTPGRWVVYFSLAALPLFGLGQTLIPAGDAGRRQWAFWLMTCYVGCGLGLLLTTAFLGLRRYLRQRKLAMPATMTGLWLGLGGALVASVIGVAAVLPRPHAEYSLIPGWGAKQERDASKYAVKGGDAGKGDGRAIDKQARDPDGSPVQGKKGDGGDHKGETGKGEKGEKGNESGENGEKGGKPDDRAGEKGEKSGGKPSDGKPGDESGGSRSSATPPPAGLPAGLEQVAAVLKWVVFAVLAIIAVVLVVRLVLGGGWWHLFGKRRGPEADADTPTEAEEVPRVPFSAFANPFDDGSAGRKSVESLVRYTFAAMEAWANERDLGRRPDETPHEFAARLGKAVPDLSASASRLAGWFSRANYGTGRLPASCRDGLRELWRALETAEIVETADEVG